MNLFEIGQKIYFKIVNYTIFRFNNVQFMKFYINGRIRIYRDYSRSCKYSDSTIFIGNRFVCNSGLKFNPIGGDACTILRTIENGIIKIGNDVGMSNDTLVARNKIIIEDNVLIGGGVKIYDNDFHSLEFETRVSKPYDNIKSSPVRICKGAFLGAGSYILKGVTVGEYSIVGAGSVVTKNIPSGEIWAGNPARFIKKI